MLEKVYSLGPRCSKINGLGSNVALAGIMQRLPSPGSGVGKREGWNG